MNQCQMPIALAAGIDPDDESPITGDIDAWMVAYEAGQMAGGWDERMAQAREACAQEIARIDAQHGVDASVT